MAIREIRVLGDDVLTKHCKEVTKMSIRTKILIEDMLDTMYEAMGVGLAAPQVGVLKRIVVIDVGEGHTDQSGDFGNFRRADRRRRMLKCTWKMWTGDKTELCKSQSFG